MSTQLQIKRGLSTGSVPTAANGELIWTTDSNKLYIGNGTDNVLINPNSVSKNYILFNNFENNQTTGWTLGTIGTLTNGLPTGTPTFGSGASGNLSIATTSSSIEGAYSLNYVSSAATTQGDMVATSSYAIDVEDQAKVLTVKFYYSIPSGAANTNFSGTSSNSYAWAIYDVTNSVWLTSAGNFNLIQSSGCGYVTGTCQTGATTANIRLVVYNANATAGAATLTLDSFYVGPQTAPSGPAMSDPVAYTPTTTGFGTITNSSFKWSRRGNFMVIDGYWTNGTAGAGATVSLPSGTAIDTTYYTRNNTTSGAGQIVGSFGQQTTNASGYMVTSPATSTTIIYMAGGITGASPIENSGTVGTSSLAMAMHVEVAIAGWSSNCSMSNDTDTRVVAMQARATGTLTLAAGSNTIYPSVDFDTHGAYNSSTGAYTVPVSGYYEVSISDHLYTSGTSGMTPAVYKNGSWIASFVDLISTNPQSIGGTVKVKCNTGDTLAIQSANASGAVFFNAGVHVPIFTIARLSGPAVVAATEKVYMQYTGNAGQSVTGNTTNIPYATKVVDSHNAWNGTTFTAPRSGWYDITCSVRQGGASSTNEIDLYINAVQKYNIGSYSGAATGTYNGAGGTYLNAGDALTIRLTTTVTLSNSAILHWIAITSQG